MLHLVFFFQAEDGIRDQVLPSLESDRRAEAFVARMSEATTGKEGDADPDFASRLWATRALYVFAIPGCATWRRPGIHTPDGGYGFRVRSLCSRPGMTI